MSRPGKSFIFFQTHIYHIDIEIANIKYVLKVNYSQSHFEFRSCYYLFIYFQRTFIQNKLDSIQFNQHKNDYFYLNMNTNRFLFEH